MSDKIDRKLWKAAEAGDEAQVGQLIDQGATVDWRGGPDWTALHRAVYRGHTSVVTRLLDAGWSLEARGGPSGWTPLTKAAEGGHPETVKCLLLRGADMDTQDDYKYTPLHIASLNGLKVIKILLQCGANQQIRNILGQTAEDAAKNEQTRAVFREFRKNGLNTNDFLNQAISEENYGVALNSILRGANFDGLSRSKLDQIIKETEILLSNGASASQFMTMMAKSR